MASANLVSRVAEAAEGGEHGFSRDLEVNAERMNRALGVGVSYDIILRRFRLGGLDVAVYIVNGFFETLTNIEILRQLSEVATTGDPGPEGDAADLEALPDLGTAPGRRALQLADLLQRRLTYSQVSIVTDFQTAVTEVLAGPMIVLVEGAPCAIEVDTRAYPGRLPSEPTIESVVVGPRDGFVENIIFNSALIRRRVKDPRLRCELQQVGVRGKTDVAVVYIDGLTNPEMVRRVKRRLASIRVDAVPMAHQAVAEFLGQASWNPLPVVRSTLRPDVAAINLCDGHVVVLVDTDPACLIVPTTMLQLVQHAEDYYIGPVFGTYLRWVEGIALVAATLLSPLWLLLATHPALLQHVPALSFIGPNKPAKVPLALQFVLAEVAIDILRRALLNSSQGLSATFGILGAVVLGDVATKTGIFSAEALVYLVFAAISSFSIANFELGMATRLVRLSLILLQWMWSLPGILIGVFFWFVLALRTESLGVPYLWPLLPFNWPALRSVLVREPVPQAGPPRPAILGPLNPHRP